MERVLVCYCFGYSEEDIVRDVMENNGTSLILKIISDEKKKGACICSTTHPLGR